jgi:putative membrane protein
MDESGKDPRVYMAAERTFLAWIRTGLALMGFGFVVARFGLFLRALSVVAQPVPQTTHFSVWVGTALVLIGVAVNVLAALHHVRLVRDLNRGVASFDRPSALAISVALVLAAVGIAMAVYLAFVR